MIKMMPISHQQSFLLSGNWTNPHWATQLNPYFELPPFTMDGILPLAYTVSEFKVRPITIKGEYKTVGTPETLTASLVLWKRGDNSDTFYYLAAARQSLSITNGLHEMYVKLSNNAEYISEPFLYVTDCGSAATTGDYAKTSPNDDYNEDYYK